MQPINEKFKFEQSLRENRKIVLLKGTIDEDTLLDGILKLGSPLVFDFSGVTAINSCGVRSWVNFIKSIPHIPIAYEHCPVVVVRQLNMVPSFNGHAKVESIYAPYICANCDTETQVLIPKEKFSELAPKLPLKCQSCQKEGLELDGHPKQYTAFIK